MTPLADMLVGGKPNMSNTAVPNAQILALSDPHLAEEPEGASP